MAECNGICVMGWELIEGATGVAHAHPECPKHGHPCRNGSCREHHRLTAALADGCEGEFCCGCSWDAYDYVWPCQLAAGGAAGDDRG